MFFFIIFEFHQGFLCCRPGTVKDVHIDLKVGPIQLKLAEGTKFGVWNSLLTIRIMSDEKPIILKFTGLSVFQSDSDVKT